MRCPFPDCPTHHQTSLQTGRLDHVADGVWLCRTCGRLVFRCVVDDCQELNRPYSRFCRHCGQSQQPATGTNVMKRWEEVQRFDFHWRHILNSPDDRQPRSLPIATSTIQELSSIKGFRQQKVLIEWAFIDGLLAIHQGGGFVALLHPFGDLAQNAQSTVNWTRPEESLLQAQDYELPHAPDGDAEVFRPYPPCATADRKLVLFSSPYAVYVVKLGSLPGWHYRAATQARVAWCADPALQTWLAAPPVLLTEPVPRGRSADRTPTHPNRIGLLLYNSSQSTYEWRVLELDAARPEEVGTTEPPASPAPVSALLPLTGYPVQILISRDQHLVFATRAGHWLWSTSDARRGETSSLLPLPSRDERADMALDKEVETRSNFSWRNQHVLRRQEYESGRREEATRQHFELCYTRFRNGRYLVERRNIWPGDPQGTCAAVPQVVFADRSARPLGDCVSADDASIREMLYLVDSAGELYRRPISGGDPRPLGNVQTGRLTDVYGLRFHDPLLVIVRKDSADEARQEVELRSVRTPECRAFAVGLSLRSDPIPWSNFLFTCEETKMGVAVVRREYAVETSDATPAFSTRTEPAPQIPVPQPPLS